MLLPNNSWPKSQRNNNRPSLAASTVCVYCRSCESCQDSSPVLGERVANLYKIECRHERQLRLLLPPLSPLEVFGVGNTQAAYGCQCVDSTSSSPLPLLAPALLIANSHFIWQADGINNCLASSASGAVIGQCASDGKISLQETSLIEIPMQRRRSLMGMPAATRSVGHSQTHTLSHAHTHSPQTHSGQFKPNHSRARTRSRKGVGDEAGEGACWGTHNWPGQLAQHQQPFS